MINESELAELLKQHDKRVTKLLKANNTEVERRRLAEAALRDISNWNQVDTWKGGYLNYPIMRAKATLETIVRFLGSTSAKGEE